MNDKVLVELSRKELNLIILGMTSGTYPREMQNEAFSVVMKLRDKLRETT